MPSIMPDDGLCPIGARPGRPIWRTQNKTRRVLVGPMRVLREVGADCRNRTGDLRVTSALLYQLS